MKTLAVAVCTIDLDQWFSTWSTWTTGDPLRISSGPTDTSIYPWKKVPEYCNL